MSQQHIITSSICSINQQQQANKKQEQQKGMKLELSLHASKLKNVAGAFRGTSDPFAVVTKLASKPGGEVEVLGRTEVVKNSLHPEWVDTIILEYKLGEPMKIAITIFDQNTKRDNKKMGTAVFEVGEILGARGNCLKQSLQDGGGTVYATITKSSGQGVFHLKMKGVKIKNVEGWFGKSDPFFEISRKANSASSITWDNVYRSKHISNNLNPNWEETVIEVSKLCNGNKDLPLLITVYDWEKSGKHNFIGRLETTLNKLCNCGQSLQIRSKNKPSGNIIIEKAEVIGGCTYNEVTEKDTEISIAAGTTPQAAGAQQSQQQLTPGGGPPLPPNNMGYQGQSMQGGMTYPGQPMQGGFPGGGPMAYQGQSMQGGFPGQQQSMQGGFVPGQSMQGGFQGHSMQGGFLGQSMQGGFPGQQQQQAPQVGGVFSPTMMAGGAALAGAAVGLAGAAMMGGGIGGGGGGGSRPNHEKNVDFVDYISGGCELNVAIAIDYTGSNGDPRRPGTLHYLHGGDRTQRNDYEKAIAAIVNILEKYDSDKMFPVYGFGAKYGGIVRHCFQCGPQLSVHGIQGVLDAYRAVFSSGLIMSGPTLFNEVIDAAANQAQTAFDNAMRNGGKQAYTILLILTDGAVTDVNATAAAISRASVAPLSIVIVGIGNADFSGMQFLDDFNSAQFGGQSRDIVQFVEFNRHAYDSTALTRETLDEIPDQLVQFFKSRGINPCPQLAGSRSDSTVQFASTTQDDQDIALDINVGSDDRIHIQPGSGVCVANGFNAV